MEDLEGQGRCIPGPSESRISAGDGSVDLRNRSFSAWRRRFHQVVVSDWGRPRPINTSIRAMAKAERVSTTVAKAMYLARIHKPLGDQDADEVEVLRSPGDQFGDGEVVRVEAPGRGSTGWVDFGDETMDPSGGENGCLDRDSVYVEAVRFLELGVLPERAVEVVGEGLDLFTAHGDGRDVHFSGHQQPRVQRQHRVRGQNRLRPHDHDHPAPTLATQDIASSADSVVELIKVHR
jgi:hypothetical protein